MWISELQVVNIKAFADSGVLKLSKGINVVVGKNNAGKTTLLQSVLFLQTSGQNSFNQAKEARRIGTAQSTIHIRLEEIEAAYFNTGGITDGAKGKVTISLTTDSLPSEFTFTPIGTGSQNNITVKRLSQEEPDNFIFPFTVKRYPLNYNSLQTNTSPQRETVMETLSMLADKIQPFAHSTHPLHKRFDELCEQLIGSPIGIIKSGNGHIPGILTIQNGSIPISQMGDGVPHILGLIVDLLKAEKKLIVIEELENSINPEPLKLLLEEIKRSAKEQHNQFIISTHSNVVLQSLASEPDCNIFEVVAQPKESDGAIPTSSCIPISNNDLDARRRVLLNLGYSLADDEMYAGWLILEESSAQTLIHDFLIPSFAPKLAKILGIIVTGGVDQAANQFVALTQNFLYLHLTPAYAQKVWVIIDAGDHEQEVIDRLRQKFPTWPPEHFSQFSEHDFERYYPADFKEEIDRVLALPTNSNEARRKKQEEKNNLRDSVMAWIKDDPVRAKKALKKSAKDVITKLKTIERKLATTTKVNVTPRRKRALVKATVPAGQRLGRQGSETPEQ